MSAGEWISIVINIAVGAYFAYWYPRHVKIRFRGRPVPPLFALLAAVLQPVGWVLIGVSVVYVLFSLFGTP